MRQFVAVAVAGCLLGSLSGCPTNYTSTGTACAASCMGCCDEQGVCQSGSFPTACGSAGAMCASCAGNQVCLQGLCGSGMAFGGGTATGGGLATGGGSATGGGVAAGGGTATGGGSSDGGVDAGTLVGLTHKPEVILVLDRSGSQNDPVDADAGSLTKWALVNASLASLLTKQGAEARFGVVQFPIDNVCAGPTTWLVSLPTGSNDDAAALKAWSASVGSAISTISPLGGTPTALALNFVATNAPAQIEGRERFAVLITDGVPNCNPSNPVNMCSGGSCTCTASSCSGTFCSLGCLDDTGAINALTALKNKGVTTTIVGVGRDVATSTTLSAMANASGAEVTCPTGSSSECGGDSTCVGSLCKVPYLQYQSEAGALASNAIIAQRIRRSGRCRFTLNKAVTAAHVDVKIDGVLQLPSNWSLAGTTLTLGPAACAAVSAADPMPQVTFVEK